MAVLTTQQLADFYESYREVELTFTKAIIRAISLRVNDVHLKVGGEQWPCVPYSASLSGARVIAHMQPACFEDLKEAKNLAALRLTFDPATAKDTLYFFVATRVSGSSAYEAGGKDVHFLDLEFTHKPADDFIEIVGAVLDANANAQKRGDERIVITPVTATRLGLRGKELHLYIDGVRRKGILRDLSFSGAKVILAGVGKFLVDKPASLKLDLEDMGVITLAGKVVRFEAVEGRRDMAAVAIDFQEDTVPVDFKLRFNQALSQQR